MVKLNHHYQKLQPNYLFTEIEKRIDAYKAKKPQEPLAHLGVGDVTMPIAPAIIQELLSASQEMGDAEKFRGYGPSQGYSFLREAICKNDYKNLNISADEIFISDGANTDLSNLQELFDENVRVALPDPAYPVYLDTTIMAGRTRLPLKTGGYGGVTSLPCTEENGFQPLPPITRADLIYLCTPSNPTGVAITRSVLKDWVDYAKKNHSILIVDAAYQAYITDPAIPKSIYEIEGAKEVAIEVKSFSKNAGFTGLRCSYTVVPHQIQVADTGTVFSLNALWKRRQDAKSNGVSYPIQRAAAAVYTPAGEKQVKAQVSAYLNRAGLLLNGLKSLGYKVFGGVDAPYIWLKIPEGYNSWSFFDHLLENANVVSLPGSGFGRYGEGYVRLTSFGSKETLEMALERMKNL